MARPAGRSTGPALRQLLLRRVIVVAMGTILDGLDRGLWWGRHHLRVAALAGAAVVVAVVVAVVLLVGGGGGSKIPDTAVAVVGDAPISTASLEHWQSVFGKAGSGASRDAARKSAF